MLAVHGLHKRFGDTHVLRGVTFSVNAGDRVAMIGPNGAGKTTLMRTLAGLDTPDEGHVARTRSENATGYLPQRPVFEPKATLRSVMLADVEPQEAAEARVEEAAQWLARQPTEEQRINQFDLALQRLNESIEAYARARSVLAQFGLAHVALDTDVDHLSGGQQTRLQFARLMQLQPELLLLDEPTNHLDAPMQAWLAGELRRHSGACLFVSHDRVFIDEVATAILELDEATGTVVRYEGNYTGYAAQKEMEREKAWQRYNDQQNEIAQLGDSAARLRGLARFRVGGKADSGDKFAKGFFAGRSAGTVARAKALERRIEHLTGENSHAKPRDAWKMRMNFERPVRGGNVAMELRDLEVGYGGTAILAPITHVIRNRERIALLGPNGAGKTTLLRTLAGELAPVSGSVSTGAGVQCGMLSQSQRDLHGSDSVLDVLRATARLTETEARTFLHVYLFEQDEVFKPLNVLSEGERARLALGLLVARGCNLLLLDEPLNHLDIASRERFEHALGSFQGTCMAATHDLYFAAGFANQFWSVENGRVTLSVNPADARIPASRAD